MDEAVIIAQLRQGEERAYKYIYDHHYAILCHVANGYVSDRFLAESLVGDTIFHLWEVRETLHIQTSLRSYLIRSVRNRCINHLRTARSRYEVPVSSMPADDPALGFAGGTDLHPLGQLLAREAECEIMKSIGRLPLVCRRVFVKSRFEGKSYADIADELGISVNTVKYHIKNALSILLHDLGRYFLFLLFVWVD